MTEENAGPAAGDHEDCTRMLCQLYFLFRLFLLPSPNLEHFSGILSIFRNKRTPFPFLWPITHHSLIIIELLANSSENLVVSTSLYVVTHRRTALYNIEFTGITLVLPRSRTGTVWFYTCTSNKRAARPKLYRKTLTRDLKRMYSRLTLVRISINL